MRTPASRTVLALAIAAALIVVIAPGAGFSASAEKPGVDRPSAGAPKPDLGGKSLPDRLLVKTRVAKSGSRAVGAMADELDFKVARTMPRLGWMAVTPSVKGESVESLAKRLKADKRVSAIERDYVVEPHLDPAVIPNDPYFSGLWGLENSGQTGGAPDADIDAPEAWATQTGSPGTVIAVVDEGVDIGHPDLSANIWVNTDEIADNGLDDDGNGYVDDRNGYDFYNYDASVYDPLQGDKHGTHVAGTIGAVGDNGVGVTGVNWSTTIMPLKFLGPDGGYTSDAVLATVYAVDNGAKVINNSWGGGAYSQALKDAIDYAASRDVLFIASAGNSGTNNDVTPSYPASYESTNVIAVASTNDSDVKASTSNYGANSVDLAAPGVDITSTVAASSAGVLVNRPPFKVAYLAFPAEELGGEAAFEAALDKSLTALGANHGTPITIVDDSRPVNAGETAWRADYYYLALDNLGFTDLEEWSTEVGGVPEFEDLSGRMVVWLTGRQNYAWYSGGSVGPDDTPVLREYLDAGGRLLLSSGEAGLDLVYFGYDPAFFSDYLGCDFVAYDPWSLGVTGATGTAFDGFSNRVDDSFALTDWPAGGDDVRPRDSSVSTLLHWDKYAYVSGTSMAAPHVSGVAGLIVSEHPGAGAWETRSRIEETVDEVPGLAGKVKTGGRLNAAAALSDFVAPPEWVAPEEDGLMKPGDYVLRWMECPGVMAGTSYEVEWAAYSGSLEGFESGLIPAAYQSGGSAAWYVDTVRHSGAYSARSGDIGNSQTSSLETTITVAEGSVAKVSFWYLLSAENNYDGLKLQVDGSIIYTDLKTTGSWAPYSFDLDPGEHRVKWIYYKDSSVSSGADSMWVDDISIGHSSYSPAGLSAPGATSMTWTVPPMDGDGSLRIRAVNGARTSEWAIRPVRFSTDGVGPGPAPLSATPGTDGDVELSWVNPADADFALTRLVRKAGALPADENDGDILYEGTATSFTDVGLPHGTTYGYATFTKDDDLNWGGMDSEFVEVVDTVAPPGVSLPAADWFEDGNYVALSWMNPIAGTMTGVRVLRRADTFPTSPVDLAAAVVYDGDPTNVVYDDVCERLSADQTHYYAMYTYDGTPLYSEPATVSVTVPAGRTPTVGITASASVISYGAGCTLTGTVTDGLGAIEGKAVQLQTSADGSTWSDAGACATDDSGRVSVIVKPVDKTYYRFLAPADCDYAVANSASRLVTPKVYLTRPSTPSRIYVNRSFTAYGYLKPRHTAGAYYVRIRAYRKVGGRYVYKKSFTAKNYNYSDYTKYSKSIKLPYRGAWGLKAHAPADSKHYATYSSMKYVTVR